MLLLGGGEGLAVVSRAARIRVAAHLALGAGLALAVASIAAVRALLKVHSGQQIKKLAKIVEVEDVTVGLHIGPW